MNRAQLTALAATSALATGTVLGTSLTGPDRLALAAALAGGGSSAAPALAQPAAGGAPGGGLAPLAARAAGPQSSPAGPQADTGGAVAATAANVASGPVSSAPPPATDGPSAPATTAPAIVASKAKHVFVVVLSGPGYDAAFGPASRMPYLSGQLRPRGALLTNYHSVSSSDLPNYIALVSGQPPNASTEADCATYSEFPGGSKPGSDGVVPGDGCVYPVETLSLPDQVSSARLRWGAYAEDMANGSPPVQSCRRPGPNAADPTQHGRPGDEYAARHNPFVYFHSLLDLGDCSANDVPLDRLGTALSKTADTPNYVFIAPNLCHDGSEDPCADGTSGGPAAADAFLAQWAPKILDSPAYRKDGVLIVTFSHPPTGDTGPVGALVLSRWVTPGATSDAAYDHYSLLRSVEDLLGLAHLAKAAAPEARGFARELMPRAF